MSATENASCPSVNADDCTNRPPHPAAASVNQDDAKRSYLDEMVKAQGKAYAQAMQTAFKAFCIVGERMPEEDAKYFEAFDVSDDSSIGDMPEEEKQNLKATLTALEIKQIVDGLAGLSGCISGYNEAYADFAATFGLKSSESDASSSENSAVDSPVVGDVVKRIPWDEIPREQLNIIGKRFDLERLQKDAKNGLTAPQLECITQKFVPCVWVSLTLEQQLEQMRRILPAEGLALAKLPCGGEVYVDLETANSWKVNVPEDVDVVLGNYGISYGEILKGHTIARAVHKADRMSLITWDKMLYLPPDSEWFSPMLPNLSFLHDMAEGNATKDSVFSGYATFELVHAYEEGLFKSVYGISDLDAMRSSQEDNPLSEESISGVEEITVVTCELVNQESSSDPKDSGDDGQFQDQAANLGEQSSSQPKRHYSMEQDSESMKKRVEACRMETEILGLDESSCPTAEELKKMDDSISKEERHVFMDPATVIEGALKALKNAIMEALERDELFIDPHTGEPSPMGFNSKGGTSFEATVRFVMSGLNGQSTQTSVISFFDVAVSPKTIWNSRRQISEECMRFVFEKFTHNLITMEELAPIFSEKLFGKYHVFGIDGSSINLPLNAKDEETYCQPKDPSRKGYNQIHGVFFYGLISGIYHGVSLNSKKKTAERSTLIELVTNNKYLKLLESRGDKYIIVADRGFESWEVFAKLAMMGVNFIIRIKDSHSGGILKSFHQEEFDQFEININMVFHAKGCKGKAPAGARYAAFLV